MFDSHNQLLSKKVTSLLFSACLVGSVQLLTGCESQPSPSDDSIAQADENTTSAQTDTPSSAADNDEAVAEQAPTSTETSPTDDQVVSPSGYQKLGFGQVVTPALLADLGLTKQESDNEQCYYVSDSKQSYMDQAYGKRASVLYQVIDGKVALITIRDPKTPFYTGVHVGDTATAVMNAHDDSLTYAVDKYAVEGDYYNLTANVNFIVTNNNDVGTLLKPEDIKMNDANDTLPIQIEYHIKGGQKLSNNIISETEWTVDNKRALKGEVESIDIGIPEAIYLVEGCS
ncbi:hypothetical protein [Psychrobacter alimentarius]|uniref:hypothetical protein n=1 Tax=Psychrobacter alimentarius TaxID=261164 RepID=UPI001919F2FC|nr:hypothetical protein [Psychrobacter alimentarius]